MYPIIFTLDDKKGQVQVPFSLFIRDPPVVKNPAEAEPLPDVNTEPASSDPVADPYSG